MPSKVPFVKDNICNENLLFVGLSETWLQTHKEAEIHIDGYTPFRCDTIRKKKSRGRLTGGVSFYVRDDIAISCEVLYSHSSECVQLLCLHSSVENLVLLAIYRQPDDKSHGHPSTSKDFIFPLNHVKALLSDLSPTPDIIFGGDFNLPHVTWPEGVPTSKCSAEERRMINALNEFCNDLFMTQYVTIPTHKDGNTLDLIFTNNSTLVHDCITIPVLQSTSHHYIVSATTSYKVNVQTKKQEKRPPLTKFKALNFFNSNTDWENMSAKLKEVEWSKELDDEDPNLILTKFYTLCLNICNDLVPAKTQDEVKKLNKVLRYRRSLSRRRRKITKRLSQVKSQNAKLKISEELLQIEKDLQKSFRNSESHMEDKAVQAIKSNSKYFFSYAKKKSKIKMKIGPLLDQTGKLTQNKKEMSEILSQQYASVFSKPTDEPINSDQNNKEIPTIPDFITAIDELSHSAAAGPDGFPAILLKKRKAELCTPLMILWNKSLEHGIAPEELKSSIITPIHKGGNRSPPPVQLL